MPQQSVPIPLPRQKNNAHAVCLACARVKYKAKMSNHQKPSYIYNHMLQSLQDSFDCICSNDNTMTMMILTIQWNNDWWWLWWWIWSNTIVKVLQNNNRIVKMFCVLVLFNLPKRGTICGNCSCRQKKELKILTYAIRANFTRSR